MNGFLKTTLTGSALGITGVCLACIFDLVTAQEYLWAAAAAGAGAVVGMWVYALAGGGE